MNAHALLTSQGWRGTGHSLHPTSDTTGLSKPLLVSQKINNLGVGKKQHKTSDMWWMNAFDKSLQGLDTSEQGKVVQTLTSGGLDMVIKGGGKWVGSGGGLYASFVRGEVLGGTLTPESQEESDNRSEIIRLRVDREVDGKESKKERRARKVTNRNARLQESANEELNEVEVKVETQEERRARRAARRALKAQQTMDEDETESMEADEPTEQVETKEVQREWKHQNKLLKKASQKESGKRLSMTHQKKNKRED